MNNVMDENKKDYYKRLHKNAEGVTFGFAKSMRSAPTIAEAILWECLRNRKLGGFKFRRQHPMKDYIADFYCPDKKLMIELDGSIHREKEQVEYDRKRTEEFQKDGIRVIRFTNFIIKNNIEKVLQEILNELQK